MQRPVLLLALAAVAMAAPRASAQVVRPPNIQAPMKAARAAAGKTNEQIRAAERAGAEPQAAQTAASQATRPTASQGKAPAPRGRASAAPGAQQGTGTVAETGRRPPTITILREAFTYTSDGRRDPFVSLMLSGELRPIITDLVLTGVIFDEAPASRRSIALLTDNSTGEKYGVRIGQTLGRMRVARITRASVTFDIDEFGLSRSETLVIDKTAAPAARRP